MKAAWLPRKRILGLVRNTILALPLLVSLGAAEAASRAVATTTVNMRLEASTSTRIVSVLKPGETVEVLGQSGDFTQVRTESGRVGYLKSKYLEPLEGAPEAESAAGAAVAVAEAEASEATAPMTESGATMSEPEAAAAAETSPPVAPAPATSGAQRMDTVEVTGTRLRRVDLETASPVFVVDRTTIERSGVATVGQLMQKMPTIAGAATNPQVNNGGGDGASVISLRGLGEDRTLLLLNGHRLSYQDVNVIPINLIERVEVVKDGATAIYGSDAIGGVVNFITTRDPERAEFSVSNGVSERADADRTTLSLSIGKTLKQGYILGGINYNDQNPIIASDRPENAGRRALEGGIEQPYGPSTAIPTGYYDVSRAAALAAGVSPATLAAPECDTTDPLRTVLTRIAGTAGTSGADFRCFNFSGPSNDSLDVSPYNYFLTPQERYSGFVAASWEFSPDLTVYLDGFANRTVSKFEQAPLPLFTIFEGFPVAADNFYNIFGEDLTDARLRLVSAGNRAAKFITRNEQFTLGGKGPIDEEWRWDGSYTYGRLRQGQTITGYPQTSLFAAGIGPSIDQNTCGTPGTPIPGCTPINFLGVPDPTVLGALSQTGQQDQRSELSSVLFTVANDTLWTIPWGAGNVGLAAGLELRREKLDFIPDALSQSGALGSENFVQPTKGQIESRELFAEANIPLLQNLPGAESLTFSFGVRRSNYSAFGDSTTTKFGLEYRPIRDLLIRATRSKVFRAPTINDLYEGTLFSSDDLQADPCDGITAAAEALNPNATLACSAKGVPTDGSFANSLDQTQVLKGGSPTVTPEQGHVTSLGFVYSASWFKPLTVELDYWRVELTNNITSGIGIQNILDLCFNTGAFCSNFVRDPVSHEVTSATDLTLNTGSLDTSGIDFGFRLNFDRFSFGKIFYKFDSTYLIAYDNLQVSGAPSSELHEAGQFFNKDAGGDGNFARFRALSDLSWTLDPVTVGLSQRYVSDVREDPADVLFDSTAGPCVGDVQPTTGAVCSRKIGDYLVHDVYVSWQVRPNKILAEVGVDNFTDTIPPLTYSTSFPYTDVRTYDTVGRFFWARLKLTF